MSTPVEVYVSAGSNIFPQQNLSAACKDLAELFGQLSRSSIYRTKAVGFDGDDFLNLVLSFSTDRDVSEVKLLLDAIEKKAGRVRGDNAFAPRTLDLDLLLYGDNVIAIDGVSIPREDILKYAFVLGPLAELAPDLVHPSEGKTVKDLWAQTDFSAQPIERLTGELL